MSELWLDKIQAYIDGKMSPEEQSRFESELSVNEELAATLSIYRTIEAEMRSQLQDKAIEASLKQTLEEAGLRHFKDEAADTVEAISKRSGTIIRIPSHTVLAVAATVLIIVALSGILYYITGNNRTKMVAGKGHLRTEKRDQDSGAFAKSADMPSKQQDIPAGIPIKDSTSFPSHAKQRRLFAMNFRPDKAPEDKCDLKDELRLYENRDYKKAIIALEEAKTDFRGEPGECDPKLEAFYKNYYLALSYMADDRAEKAIPELETALQENTNGFNRSKTQWYLALAYLKKGEWVKAEKLLNELAGGKQAREYKGMAIKLLENGAKYK